jgi:hypothetical protein
MMEVFGDKIVHNELEGLSSDKSLRTTSRAVSFSLYASTILYNRIVLHDDLVPHISGWHPPLRLPVKVSGSRHGEYLGLFCVQLDHLQPGWLLHLCGRPGSLKYDISPMMLCAWDEISFENRWWMAATLKTSPINVCR